MNYNDLLHNDHSLTLIAAVFGVVWSTFQSSDYFQRRRSARMLRALGILETAVARTWETYVRAIKQGRADGKLTATERTHARRLAAETAIEIARREGINLLRTLGHEHLDRHITTAARARKR
jgi:predicted alternative tryptophan synthase beta-subunit